MRLNEGPSWCVFKSKKQTGVNAQCYVRNPYSCQKAFFDHYKMASPRGGVTQVH